MPYKQSQHPGSKRKPKPGAGNDHKVRNRKEPSPPRNRSAKPVPNKQDQVVLETEQVIPELDEINPVNPDYIIIAQITAPFGLRGAVKAEIRTDFPERFEKLEEVWLAPPNSPIDSERFPRKVISARLQNEKQVVIRFEGLTKPEQAEELKWHTVAVPRTEVIPLPEGEYYIFQLVGLEIYTEEGEYVGKVLNVLEYPANDVYEVRSPMSPKPVLIPAIKDVIKEIDLENKRITITLIEGLI